MADSSNQRQNFSRSRVEQKNLYVRFFYVNEWEHRCKYYIREILRAAETAPLIAREIIDPPICRGRLQRATIVHADNLCSVYHYYGSSAHRDAAVRELRVTEINSRGV